MHWTLTASCVHLSSLTSNQSSSFASILTRFVAQRLLQLKVLQFKANLHSDIFAGLFTLICAIYGLVVVALLCSCVNLVFSSVFFTRKPNFAPTHLSQLDQRVLLYLPRHQIVLSFSPTVYSKGIYILYGQIMLKVFDFQFLQCIRSYKNVGSSTYS